MNKPLLIAVAIAGLAFRCSGLWYGIPSKNKALTSYHPDEPKSYYSLAKMNPSEFNFHPGDGFFWGSLHLYTLGFSLQTLKWLGIIKDLSREALQNNLREADKLYLIGRMVSVCFGVGTILIVYILGTKTGGPRTGALSALLLAIAPVHVIHSFIVRPDIMMVFLAAVAILFSVVFLETRSPKHLILSSLFVGLSAATKYNGGAFIAAPATACFLNFTDRNYRSILKCLTLVALFSFIGFAIGCPYALIDPKSFLSYFNDNLALSKHGMASPFAPAWISYFTTYLPIGFGRLMVLLAIPGFLVISMKTVTCFKSCDLQAKKNLLLLISFLCIYVVSVMPKHQMVFYTLPIAPFLVIFCASFIDFIRERFFQSVRVVSWLIICCLVGYTAVYSLATLRLYWGGNVREDASEWIEKNIPAGQPVGIARSYFWTPGILRQYHPPYRLLEGGDSQSVINDAVLGLKKVSEEANTIVLTEYEYRNYLHPRLSSSYPEQAGILNSIMNQKFQEVARFSRETKFLWFRFHENSFLPYDWIMPNPEIRVFVKN